MTDGLVTLESRHDYRETVSKLEAAISGKGLTIFARMDHAAGAEAAGLALRPTLLLLFGNAKGGTPLMQEAQVVGIDLPLKILIWEDERGITWISYNDPTWIAVRHGLSVDAQISVLTQVIRFIANEGST
jgi:uncharacterized protein (DUF302 family)